MPKEMNLDSQIIGPGRVETLALDLVAWISFEIGYRKPGSYNKIIEVMKRHKTYATNSAKGGCGWDKEDP